MDSSHPKMLSDCEWLKKLRAVDDEHTSAYRLDEDSFNKMVDQLERIIAAKNEEGIPEINRVGIIECYSKNLRHTLQCELVFKKFVSSIDSVWKEKNQKDSN